MISNSLTGKSIFNRQAAWERTTRARTKGTIQRIMGVDSYRSALDQSFNQVGAMEELSKRLYDVVKKYQLIGVIVARSDGQEILRVGNFERLKWTGLLSEMFGGSEQIRRLSDSLDSQLLPQLYSQGDEWFIVSKHGKSVVYGLCTVTEADAVTMYHQSKEIADAVNSVIEEHLQ